MSQKNQVFWGEGVAFVDGVEVFEVQELVFNFGIEVLEALKGDGGGNIRVPTRQPISGRCGFLGMNAPLFAKLTGATNATGYRKRVRGEAQTKVTNDVTLANTPIANTVRIVADGANKLPLTQVSATPQVGEYTISGDTITLNASQTEDDFLIDYVYVDGANGLTATIAPNSLPDSFELIGTLRTKELFADSKDDIVVYAAKCERTSEFTMGSQNGQISTPGFDFSVRIDSSGDFEVTFP